MSEFEYYPAYVSIDPVATTNQLAIVVDSGGKGARPFNSTSAIAILSRREVERLAHQLNRWLNWDRSRQGTPRTYQLRADDLYPTVLMPAHEAAKLLRSDV